MTKNSAPTRLSLCSEQPLAVNLINTRTKFRGNVIDQLSDIRSAQIWLDAAGSQLGRIDCAWGVDARRLLLLRNTRRAITHLADVYTARAAPTEETVHCLGYLNQQRTPARFHLAAGKITISANSSLFESFRQAIIDSAATVLSAPPRLGLRRCANTECLHYFVPYVERRLWCTGACGNRVRVARHWPARHAQPRRTPAS
ncbi:CGNR zinc finger domain-containing protein [Rhodococcus pyridinivorans]|uniref:CGNR zinc finger domain-containing protein n=1 Tax=Rhodococcus TaxID=1827 RepID=UPI0020CE51B7|nr:MULTISPECIES: CGNR zinc finger domain-containing protein [Rhodococcus]UVT25956.1 CGNR zinc finger domain-containing protein [Rhodococcus pyridinivorans]